MDLLQDVLVCFPPLRRATWRMSRRFYCAARGEPRRNTIATNGEAYVQAQVAAGVPSDQALAVCDVGANEGQWTMSMLKAVHDSGRDGARMVLHAFEPVGTTRERLAANIRNMKTLGECVRIQPHAVSDVSGTAVMAINSESGGTNSLHPGPGRLAGENLQVETIALDAFVQANALPHLHLVKCDAEGHDMHVIRGAKGLLGRGRIDVLQFEYNHRWILSRHYLRDVFDFAADLPYSIARVMPAYIEVVPEWHPELERFFEANYLLVRDEVVRWFDARHGGFDAANVYC